MPSDKAPGDQILEGPQTITRHPLRSFVVRAGRMGPGQQRALETLGPQFIVPHATTPMDREVTFGRRADLIVEIGFGMGQATAAFAFAHPEINLLGMEVHPPGVGSMLKQIGEARLLNMRIVQHDAVEVLRDMIEPDSLAGIHCFFPDPWHKKRHHKRRLIQAPFVQQLAQRLKPGGYLHLATDWQPYAEQMLEVLNAEALLQNTSGSGYTPRPASRPITKFERRGLALGHGVWDLLFVRR